MDHPEVDNPSCVSTPERQFFVVYGMPRTGTTYLYHALSAHPGIFTPYRKESMFFSVNFDKGFDWYEALFSEQAPDEIAADINPMYFMDDESLKRILEYNPLVKIVVGVREPVDFAASLYGNIIAHGHDAPSIVETMRHYEWKLTPSRHLRVCLDNSFISRRIKELCETFGENLLLYDFEYFSRSPLPVLKAIESFLGLPTFFNEENYEKVKINATGRKNILGVNKLLTNQRVLEAAYRVLPNFAIRKIRTMLEKLSAARVAKQPAGRSKMLVSEADLAELGCYLRDDQAFYRQLFASAPTILGSEARPDRQTSSC